MTKNRVNKTKQNTENYRFHPKKLVFQLVGSSHLYHHVVITLNVSNKRSNDPVTNPLLYSPVNQQAGDNVINSHC